MICLLLSLSVFYGIISCTAGTCMFPANLTGTWISADRGDLLFNATSMRGYPTSTNLGSVLDFNCQEQSGTVYFLIAEQYIDIFGRITRFYLCLEIIAITENLMIYYIGTEYDMFAQDTIYGISDAFANLTMGCNRARPYNPETFITLLRKNGTGAVLPNDTCPTDLLARFDNVTITASNGISQTATGSCQGSTLDVCADRSVMQFNNNCTSPKPISTDGAYTCLYSLTNSGHTYLSVWNNDATVDGTSTFRFSCFSFRKIGGVVYATESPEYCSNTTTSTSTDKGFTMFFTSITETCLDPGAATAPSEPMNLTFLYALLVIPFIFLVLLLILLFVCLYKKYGKRKKTKTINISKGDKVEKTTFPKNKLTPLMTKPPAKDKLFRPKRPIDVSIYDLNFETGSFPIIKPLTKIAPIYRDSIIDYMRERAPRRPSALSLYSFDSVVCKNTPSLHDARTIFTPSIMSETVSRPSTRWSIRSTTSFATTESDDMESSRISSRATLIK